MKSLKTILFVLGILFSGGVVLILTPGIWQNKIETVLNEKFLSEKGWHLSIGTLKGHFFTTVIMEDILLWHIDGSNVLSNKIRSKINIIPLITGKLSLELLEINEIEAALKENSIITPEQGKVLN